MTKDELIAEVKRLGYDVRQKYQPSDPGVVQVEGQPPMTLAELETWLLKTIAFRKAHWPRG